MLSTDLKLAWQFYRQENASLQQRFMRWTQAILMVFIATLSQTSQSIQDYLSGNLNNLLGADVVIMQQHPLSERQEQALTRLSQTVLLTQNLHTTLTYKDKWQRVKLKGVGAGYPLQGELVTSTALTGDRMTGVMGPAPGEMWVDSRVLSALSMQLGDEIQLAGQVFRLSRILLHEPDRLMEGHSVDMRVMIHLSDLNRLGFPQAQLEHRYLIAAQPDQIEKVVEWQKQQLPAAQIYHKQGAHPLALFWQRTENVIGLASIILFFMAAIAIDQLGAVQMRKEQYFSAVCMSLGASKSHGVRISVLKWGLNLLFLLPPVLFFSAACHWLCVYALSETFTELHWQWQPGSAAKSVLAMWAIFLVFQAPVWWALRHSSVIQLVNNQSTQVRLWVSKGSIVLVLACVAFAFSDNALLTSMLLGAMAICILLMLGLSWMALTLGEKVTKNVSGLIPFALFMMKQRLVSKTTQILGVGLCAFLLLFTLMLLRDIGNTMSAYQREHDGNLMITQATGAQMVDVSAWSQANGGQIRQSKPYVHAKLTHINEQTLDEFTQTPSESLAILRRSIRLHWSDAVPKNNRIVEGQWWTQEPENWQQISVEQEVMTDVGLALGDTLTLFIGQRPVDFTVVASHVFQSGSGSITFWLQVPPEALRHLDAPRYRMASVELPDPAFAKLGSLWKQHPSLRMISLNEMTSRFDKTLAMVTQVISGFSGLIILLAGIVILASVHALEGKEKKKNSVLMSFGFSRGTCLKLNMMEWLVTGAIAAGGAIMGTYLAGVMIYESQFSMTYQPQFSWLLGTLVIILSTITAFGVLASRASLSSSVRELLAET